MSVTSYQAAPPRQKSFKEHFYFTTTCLTGKRQNLMCPDGFACYHRLFSVLGYSVSGTRRHQTTPLWHISVVTKHVPVGQLRRISTLPSTYIRTQRGSSPRRHLTTNGSCYSVTDTNSGWLTTKPFTGSVLLTPRRNSLFHRVLSILNSKNIQTLSDLNSLSSVR